MKTKAAIEDREKYRAAKACWMGRKFRKGRRVMKNQPEKNANTPDDFLWIIRIMAATMSRAMMRMNGCNERYSLRNGLNPKGKITRKIYCNRISGMEKKVIAREPAGYISDRLPMPRMKNLKAIKRISGMKKRYGLAAASAFLRNINSKKSIKSGRVKISSEKNSPTAKGRIESQ